MRSFRPFLLACCTLPLLASGCAKSPAGGPTTQTANRIQAQLTIVGTINPLYHYGVAFDDNGGDGQGPEAIIGNTNVTNGVVGGTYRLLVLYNAGRFQVFYRPTPSDPSEREITGTNNLFVTAPRATTNGLNFTINLDARLSDGTYIFPRGTNSTSIATSRFDINVVTTGPVSSITNDPNNNLVRAVDALGPQQIASPVEVQIGGTRSTVIQDATGAATDENLNADPAYTTPGLDTYVDFNRIDIDNLALAITRSSN